MLDGWLVDSADASVVGNAVVPTVSVPLLMTDLGIDPAQLVAILHYDGTPITARFIHREIAARSSTFAAPLTREAVS